METLASVWTHDPCDPRDLRDLGEKQHEPSSVWESQGVFSSSPPAGLMWTEQLSPHLQRNKQLQDTLLQRDEELARLQEENNKLRAFLGSSFVTTLEQKAKKLTADGRKKLKRNLTYMDEGPFPCGHQFVASQPVSKRVCRNLTAEFCSESSEASASSEPQLDIWVLRMLGLKDRDTIDTSNDSLSSPGYSLRGVVYDTAVSSSSSSSGYTLNSLSPSVSTSTPSSAHSYCQSSTCQPEYRYSATKCQEAICGDPAESAQTCTTSPGPHSDFTATALTRQYEAPEDVTRSYNTLPFTQSPDRAEICSITASSRAQTLEGNSAYWSPPTGSQTPSEETFQFSSPAERIHFSPILSSTPVSNQPWTTGCSPTNLSAGSQPPVMPQTPRGRTDLAFSMSLCPSSSVKTHSFPQGQAFIRKDTEGRWNFTWVPRQGP